MDTGTGQIVTATLTRKVDDGAQLGPLRDQVAALVSSFTADSAYDQDSVSAAAAERRLAAAMIVRRVPRPCRARRPKPRPRSATAIFSPSPSTAAQLGKASGHTIRARAEAAEGWFKQVIGNGLRSRTDQRRATVVNVAVHALDRMLDLRRPASACVA